MFGFGKLKCVSYGIVCGIFYCVDNEKAMIKEDDCHERELRKLIVETHLGRFLKFFFLIMHTALIYFAFHLSIYRTPNLMRPGLYALPPTF